MLTGQGCDAGSAVTVEVDDQTLLSAVATAGGSFSETLELPGLGVGRHRVVARCGPTLVTSIDVVLVTRVEPATTTLALLVFFVLLVLAALRRQRGNMSGRP